MKLLTLVGKPRRQKLLNPTGEELAFFSQFRDELFTNSGLSNNTIKSYLGHIARFIEFIHACQIVCTRKNESINAILPAFEEYLLGPVHMSTSPALQARELTRRTSKAKPISLIPVEAAIHRFLWYAGISSDRSLRLDHYIDTANRTREFTQHEICALRNKSESYGLYSNRKDSGGKKARRNIFIFKSTSLIGRNHDELAWVPQKAMPTEKIARFIDALPTYRDRAIACLKIASGIRSHEALQLTDDEIDIASRTVWIISDVSNKRVGLTAADLDKYANKGRETSETWCHEPWISWFFENLLAYTKFERLPGVGHKFCFQILHGVNKGRPLFTAHRSSLNRIFHRAAKAAEIILVPGIAEHSMRHHYGVWCKHFAPTLAGNGFPELVVQTYMGHKSLSSTKKYIKKTDREWLDTSNEIINRTNTKIRIGDVNESHE
ncbi:tyrosine-type recombinase/integrase [Pseudomonas zeae]|uniref:Site-specific integrase n=1 Tax=Pseudomonas zeae TaxID=2745510 RepID=A0A9E6NNU1_9PSED|nr:site-specific integrase [Pseudomonas zeae]QXI11490.1 site-specific integrase [Pseudomonas zeae]